MSQPNPSRGTVVVPFPVRARPDSRRVTGSMCRLEVALQEQASAVAAWRAQLGELRTAVRQLEVSLGECAAVLHA
jgi:hypothetical protein